MTCTEGMGNQGGAGIPWSSCITRSSMLSKSTLRCCPGWCDSLLSMITTVWVVQWHFKGMICLFNFCVQFLAFFLLTALLRQKALGLKAALKLPHLSSFQWETAGHQEVTLYPLNFQMPCRMSLSCLISKHQDCKSSPWAAWRIQQSHSKNLLSAAVPRPTCATAGATWGVTPPESRNKLIS